MRKRKEPSLQRVLSREMHCSRRRIYVSDPHFDPITPRAMSGFLAYDYTNNGEWKKDIWDCDNFALQFVAAAQRYFAQQGINAAIGIIWTDVHAFNFYLSPAMKVGYIEPQSDLKTFLTARVKLVVI